jgi:hypothetical protein
MYRIPLFCIQRAKISGLGKFIKELSAAHRIFPLEFRKQEFGPFVWWDERKINE